MSKGEGTFRVRLDLRIGWKQGGIRVREISHPIVINPIFCSPN